jgi:hypothetical protein
MRSRAAYAAELQGILGEDTWNALMDGQTDSGGAGSAGGGGQMMR